ncbi:unnamed protein product [Allacma fusca]|uniref:Uncharacterized protein n=1 Tax=Allacma fusca TaxID=39272 RepID=A0A8J2LDA6_9HEXA|nr:unnamed protein product [Allacma fusca]
MQWFYFVSRSLKDINVYSMFLNGTEITDQDVRCILEKLKYIKGGKVAPNVIIDSIQEIFPGHWGTLTSSVFQCAQESLKKSDQTDKFKHVNCRMNAYKDVCGHKTCDWINSFD